MLARARLERDELASQLEQLELLPIVALHPTVIADYRTQVNDLSSISRNPEARLEAIPKLPALIEHVSVYPSGEDRSFVIEVTGRLNAMLALAASRPITSPMYPNVGAGEGNHLLPSFLRALV